ncbi:MAG: DUF6265 family protein [Bacteroidota bacterium]
MANRTRLGIRLGLLTCALCGMISMSPAQDGSPRETKPVSVDELSWLAGHWFGQHRGVRMEELWLPPEGGMMLGVHRDVPPEGKTIFEFLRIGTDGGTIVYFASPGGRNPVPFPLKELSEQWVVFENPENEYPQRIIYLREGKQLHARIEGEREGKIQNQSWIWFGK